MNKLFIIGNLTKKPETKAAGTGQVTRFTVAVNEANNQTLFLEVNAWNKLGENAQKYLDKGSKVCVVGRLTCNEYESNGEKRKAYAVTASDIEFLSSKTETTAEQPQAQPRAIDQLQEVKVDDDDMPF